MTLNELDEYFKKFLAMDEYKADPSQNGLQVQNHEPSLKKIQRVAFAVDASLETLQRAAAADADVLFTHHGLLWGECERMNGFVYERYKTCIEHDLALYAVHIPLDANEECGNNWGLARALGLQKIKPFGVWKEMVIGVKGTFNGGGMKEVERALVNGMWLPQAVWTFGKEVIKTVGIISGGAGGDLWQAVEEGLDLYITGSVEHELYHYAKENKINVLALGHYQSETVGVKSVAQKLTKECGIETIFIDIPTGL